MNRRPKRGRESNSDNGDPIKRTKTEDEVTTSTGELTSLNSQVPKDDKLNATEQEDSASKEKSGQEQALRPGWDTIGGEIEDKGGSNSEDGRVHDAEDRSNSDTSDEDYDPDNDLNVETDDDTSKGYERPKATAMSATDIANIKRKLGIDEDSMLQHFKEMNIYHHVQRVPKEQGPEAVSGEMTSRKPGTHHTASSVTQQVLAQYGGWQFTSSKNWSTNAMQKISKINFYKPLSTSGTTIATNLPPFEPTPGATKIEQKHKPHKDIESALRQMKQKIEDPGLQLNIPAEWWDDVKEGIGEFPEIPARFRVFLEEEHQVTGKHGQDEQHQVADPTTALSPITIVSATHSSRETSPSTPTTPRALPNPFITPVYENTRTPVASRKHESGPVTKSARDVLSPCPPREGAIIAAGTKDNVNPQGQEETEAGSSPASTAASSTVPDNGFQRLLFPSLVESIGERRARELSLSMVNKENAIRLRDDLWPVQCAYRIKESKLHLCQMVYNPDYRKQSDVFSASLPYNLVQFKPRAEIIQNDLATRCGSTVINEDTDELLFTSMEIIRRWLGFQGLEDYRNRPSVCKGKRRVAAAIKASKKSKVIQKEAYESRKRSEGSIERSVGGLLQGIFLSEDLLVTENVSMVMSKGLRFLGTNPSPDLGVQPHTEGWATDWADCANILSPCVFSAECKREETYSKDCDAQLAMNNNATIEIFTMMHLDTRSEQFEKLPGWMCIYGLIYTELGFHIYAHYPSVHITTGKGEGWHWRPISCLLSNEFSHVFNQAATSSDYRTRAIRVLLMLRSHALFLVEQIRHWAEERGRYNQGNGTMDKLIADAKVQMKRYDWLLAQIKESSSS